MCKTIHATVEDTQAGEFTTQARVMDTKGEEEESSEKAVKVITPTTKNKSRKRKLNILKTLLSD